MSDKRYSGKPKNEAEKAVARLTERLADTFEEFGVEVYAVCIRVKGQTPDCSAVLSADKPEEARELLLRTAALVFQQGAIPGDLK